MAQREEGICAEICQNKQQLFSEQSICFMSCCISPYSGVLKDREVL